MKKWKNQNLNFLDAVGVKNPRHHKHGGSS